nr:hypothetical protein [Xanthomonas campestris]WVL60695.1 hypothetical protein LLE68_021145 [Xanthomonas campestris pv. barbareae]
MQTPDMHRQREQLLNDLRASGTAEAASRAAELQQLYHAHEMASLADDVYDSAKGLGHSPVGWIRGSENIELLQSRVPELRSLGSDRLKDYLKPDDSGFRAEIYIPDPAILGPGYKPTVVYKGSAGEVATANGLRDTSAEDFLANNFPQSVGMQTDYYDRAMQLAATLKEQRVHFEIAGHSLGGGMGSAASAVSGAPATTFNAAGLHPVTAQRFALANGLPTYDTANTVVAYQVQGEMLNNGIQDNIHRLDAARRQQLAAVMGDTATLMRSLPEGQALLDQALTRDVPVNAQPAVHAFVDRLAQGDTARLLQQLPLAAGRIEPVLPAKMQGQDGALVDRAQALTLQESLYLAGPALGVLRAGAAGAQIGRGLGEHSAALGRAGDAALDAAGDGAARGMQMGGRPCAMAVALRAQHSKPVATRWAVAWPQAVRLQASWMPARNAGRCRPRRRRRTPPRSHCAVPHAGCPIPPRPPCWSRPRHWSARPRRTASRPSSTPRGCAKIARGRQRP